MRHVKLTIRAAAVGAALLLLSACGQSDEPPGYSTEERFLTVDKGEKFSITVHASPTLGQNWHLTDPHPDRAVLHFRGKRSQYGDSEPGLIGAAADDDLQSFDFTARGAGTVKIRLLYCPAAKCHGPDETGSEVPVYPSATNGEPRVPSPTPSWSPFPTVTGSPGAAPEFHVWTVTVR